MALYRGLRKREVRRNYLIGRSVGDHFQNLNFAFGERILKGMFAELSSYLIRNSSPSGMDNPNSVEQFLPKHVLQEVSESPRLEGSQRLNVTSIGREDNDPGGRKFSPYRLHGFDAVHARHLNVHEGDIWPQKPKSLQSFK